MTGIALPIDASLIDEMRGPLSVGGIIEQIPVLTYVAGTGYWFCQFVSGRTIPRSTLIRYCRIHFTNGSSCIVESGARVLCLSNDSWKIFSCRAECLTIGMACMTCHPTNKVLYVDRISPVQRHVSRRIIPEFNGTIVVDPGIVIYIPKC